MVHNDLVTIALIERQVFPLPWSLEMMTAELKKPNCRGLVATLDGVIIGYLLVTCLGDAEHIMTFAVVPQQQNQRVGGMLLEAVLADDARRYTLEVRPSNTAALRLYARHGFLVAGLRRRYYADNGEDALVMWRTPSTLKGLLHDVPAFAADFPRV